MFIKTYIVSFILIFIMFINYSQAVPKLQCITDGLVSFWTFDKSDAADLIAKDIWGGKDATLKEGARISPGKIDEALELDGVKGFAEVLSDPVFDFGKGDYTIEAWMKVEKVARYPIVFRGQWATPMYAYELTLRISSPYNGCYGRMYDGKGYMVVSSGVDKSDYLSDNQWHHIAFVRAAKSFMYIDGEAVGNTDTLAGINATSNQNILIGKDPDPNFFKGMIDELRLYNKALSADDVQHNFNLTSNGLSVDSLDKLSVRWGRIKTLLTY
jgi:hypothetical protein